MENAVIYQAKSICGNFSPTNFQVNQKALPLHLGRPTGLQRIVNLSRKDELRVLSTILEKDNTLFCIKT